MAVEIDKVAGQGGVPREGRLDKEPPQVTPTMLLALRTELSTLTPDCLVRARGLANPTERLGRLGFISRAAVKMAELDQFFPLTYLPPEGDGTPRAKRPRIKRDEGSPESPALSPDTLTFVDLCGGPGGFSEYILWHAHRSGIQVKGWGMTLRREDKAYAGTEKEAPDFDLEGFRDDTVSTDCMTLVYGPDGTGDVLRDENRQALINNVDRVTEGQGVHLVMADGAFDVTGQEEEQESLLGHLLLAQFHLALSMLREGGHFLCKVFDATTRLSTTLLYLLTKCFAEVDLTKPFSSRPANSERYVVARGLNTSVEEVKGYLNRAIHAMEEGQCPMDTFPEDFTPTSFHDHLHDVNQCFNQRQGEALALLLELAEDPEANSPFDHRGNRDSCIEEWDLYSA
ncbi:MAG: FtsJ-like methyltransferase-domain-containing protein [Piptocephalis tieghemiana]|nr:MAG: FtsJ-like methyltransferase-domain-containing protein [Piptocephalis tieghemiana]